MCSTDLDGPRDIYLSPGWLTLLWVPHRDGVSWITLILTVNIEGHGGRGGSMGYNFAEDPASGSQCSHRDLQGDQHRTPASPGTSTQDATHTLVSV